MGAHAPYLAVVLAAAVLMSLPLFQFRLPSGHDALEYPPRLAEFCSLLAKGNWFPTWAPDLNSGYGTPLFSFNAPLFYYLAALYHGIGADLVVSIDLAAFAIMLLAGCGMYLLASGLVGRHGACLAAVAYLTAPYLLCDLYVRMALAEFTAFAFMPFAFWALRRVACGEIRLLHLLTGALALAAICLSHNVAALIIFPAALAYVLLLAIGERSRRGALCGVLMMGLGLGLSAWFWFPALMEKDWVKTWRLLAGYLNYQNHFVYVYQLVYSKWGYGLSVPGPDKGMSFRLGLVQLAGVATAGGLIARKKLLVGGNARHYWFLLWAAAAAAFMTCGESIFIWRNLRLLQYAEFPWRFLLVAAFALAVCFGFLGPWIESLRESARRPVFRAIVVALLLTGFLIAQAGGFLDVSDSTYAPARIAADGIAVSTANEYEPAWVKETPAAPAQNKLQLLGGSARITSQSLSPLSYVARVQADTETWLRLNVSWYPAWKTTVDGRPVMPDYNNPHGVMDFLLEPGSHEVSVVLSRTAPAFIGALLAMLALALLLVLAAALVALRPGGEARFRAVGGASAVLLGAFIFAFLLNDARDIGVPVDEGPYCFAAGNAADWSADFASRLAHGNIAQAFSDELVSRYWSYNHEHPAFSKFLAAVSHALLKWLPDQLLAYRAGYVLLYLLLAVVLLLFLRTLYGWTAASFAAASVLLIPPLYGHAHLVGLDFPVAAMSFFTVVAFYLGIANCRWSILCGILYGLALNCKINALFLAAPLVLWALLYHRRQCLPNLLAIFLIAPLVMAATWPWLWHHPMDRAWQFLSFHASHEFFPEFYLGKVYDRPPAPWHFPFVMTLVSLPIGILTMVFVGLGRWLRGLLRDDKTALFALNFLCPLLVSAVPFAPKYNGARLFLTCFPFAACLAGIGFAAFTAWLRGKLSLRPAAGTAALWTVATLLAGSAFVSLRMIHPYEGFGYYNLLVGGRPGAHKLGFESTNWGNAGREVVDYLNESLESNATIYNNTGAATALVACRELGALRRDIGFADRADYLVLEINEAWSRWPRWEALCGNTDPEYELIRTFEKSGVPLFNLYRKRSGG
jgi:4-amino-4-deoxy-L-arabinose transferase-like glycosyltransferase